MSISAPGAPVPATPDDLFTTDAYEDHDITFEARPGKRVTVVVHARELSWEQQTQIAERHTTVTKLGRNETTKVRHTAIMTEILAAMIEPTKCQPPIPDVRKLRTPFFDALVHHFGLNRAKREEVEDRAGESGAP